MKNLLLVLFLVLCMVYGAFAQCTFDPTVEGNLLLCPNEVSTLTTQEYDTYQWYRRNFGTTTTVPVSGATAQELSINYTDDIPVYFSVEVSQGGCTERSPEVLVDGLVFLSPTVITEGDFEIGNNGETLACLGDTIFLTFNLPYDTLITWYRNDVAIPNENEPVLEVTTSGNYYVSGAPSDCPDYIQFLGVQIEVIFSECMTGIGDPIREQPLRMYPNPVVDVLHFAGDVAKIQKLELFAANGQRLPAAQFTLGEGQINVGSLAAGMYMISYVWEGKTYQQRFLKQ